VCVLFEFRTSQDTGEQVAAAFVTLHPLFIFFLVLSSRESERASGFFAFLGVPNKVLI